MATEIEVLARQITDQVLLINAGGAKTIGDLTNNDASGSIYQSWINICTPLVPWINTHGSGSVGSGSVWGSILGTLSDQLDLQAALNAKQSLLGYTPENIANKSNDTNLGTGSAILYPTQNAVKTYVNTQIAASSSVATASNLGTGSGIFSQKVGNDLQFKSLIGGNNIVLSSSSVAIIISGSGNVPESRTINSYPLSSNITLYKVDIGLGNVDNTSDGNKPLSSASITALANKVDANSPVVSNTKTKITYDIKGLVTSGSVANTGDIEEVVDKRYVTDANLVVLGNTSGVNTGNETNSSIKAALGTASLTNDGYLRKEDFATFSSGSTPFALNDLTDVDTTGVTNGQALVYDNSLAKWVPGTLIAAGLLTSTLVDISNIIINSLTNLSVSVTIT